MPVDLRGVVTVLLPGTGSDDEYLTRAFADPLRAVGAKVVAVRPEPAALLAGYVRALQQAAADGPIAVGGVSLGAAVAAGWALEHPTDVVAVLAALPPNVVLPAFLILHGADDRNISRIQSGRLFMAILSRPGTQDLHYHLLPESGHGTGAFKRLDPMLDVVTFLRDRLGA